MTATTLKTGDDYRADAAKRERERQAALPESLKIANLKIRRITRDRLNQYTIDAGCGSQDEAISRLLDAST